MGNRIKSQIKPITAGNLPVVVYRLPDDEFVHFVGQHDQRVKEFDLKDIDKVSGFLLSPFFNNDKFYCVRPDVHEKINAKGDKLSNIFKEFFANREPMYFSEPEISKNDYLKSAKYLIDLLKKGEIRKVVLSRVINQNLTNSFDPLIFFEKLMEEYPKSFTYFFSLPGIGTWVGATPETLLTMESDHAETVALAGTRLVDDFEWTEKEITEQRIVMDYIEEILSGNGIPDYERKGPFTVKAGNIVHLKTSFNLSLKQLEGKVGKLIAGLHPTPAVCGLPRSKSYELIRNVETHDRSFYAGFLGPWNLSGESRLFVNLRCAAFGKNKMSLFVGGGLTTESIPEAEWEETVRKSQTLLSVLEKL